MKLLYKSITYIDSHAGSGYYNFNSEYMSKNKEYEEGINKLSNYKSNNRSIKYYLKVLRNINNSKKLILYPGSPSIMSYVTDKEDKLFFYELHKNEFKILKKNLSKKINAKIFNQDGFNLINDKIKENEKTLILIDPSYEIKDDFEKVINKLEELNNFYTNTTALVWYPVLNIEKNDLFIENIRKIGSNRITRVELPFKKYNDEIGMKGCGIIVFNGNNFLIKNIKECSIELYKLFKNEDCNIKPKIQRI
tara:strand:+ start:188 stop:937 length:750 start_codon:yes stop_codon:yes gene_type:complete